MQVLEVRNFLGIKSAKIESAGLTVVIGEQASGKSVVARLFYYFNQYFADFDDLSLSRNEHKKTYDKRKKEEFYQIFPTYAWEDDDFSINYKLNEFEISITSAKNSTVIEVKSSVAVAMHFRNLKQAYKKFAEVTTEEAGRFTPTRLLREFKRSQSDYYDGPTFQEALFVPAARSFYATIRDEIFSILALDTKIDKIILQFGEFYETQKFMSGMQGSLVRGGRRIVTKLERRYFEKIVKGQYVRDDDRDWIEMDRGRIELSKASSGQQEAVPLIFAITRFPSSGKTLVIEEPEAHLFPESQISVLELMALQVRQQDASIVFTTHSPYLLTALNTLLTEYDSDSKIGFPFEKVRAYALRGGRAIDLCDKHERLVSADYIDEVSEKLETRFAEALK